MRLLTWIGVCSVAFAYFGLDELIWWRPIPGLLAPTDDLRSYVQRTIIGKLKMRRASKVRIVARPCVTFYLRTAWKGEIVILPDFKTWISDTKDAPGIIDCSLVLDPGYYRGGGILNSSLFAFSDLSDPTMRPGGILNNPPAEPYTNDPTQFTSLPNLLDWGVADSLDFTKGEPDPRTFNGDARLRLIR